MEYEINYLVLQSKTGQMDQIRQETKTLIEGIGGKITDEKNYLKRKLAYEIKHENYGFYTVLRFTMEDREKIAELKRELNLSPNITRHIIVNANSLPPLQQTPTSNESETVAEQPTEAAKSKDVLEEIINQPKPAPAKTEEKPAIPEEKKEVADQEKPATQEKEVAETQREEKSEEKPTTPAPAAPPVEEKTKEKAPEPKDDKASLEELDKKLDEILNI